MAFPREEDAQDAHFPHLWRAKQGVAGSREKAAAPLSHSLEKTPKDRDDKKAEKGPRKAARISLRFAGLPEIPNSTLNPTSPYKASKHLQTLQKPPKTPTSPHSSKGR